MRVILIRHGEALSSSPLGDEGRCLSVRGREQARATGRALAGRGFAPDRVWASPLVRAQQTAELVVAGFTEPGYAGLIEARDDLYPDSPIESLTQALARLLARSEADAASTLIAVGHMPYMAAAASTLLGCSVSGFGTGHAYVLEVAGLHPHRVELEWRWLG